ncbi:hypothetical protein [Deinococcus arcticus]|uniref:Uncharacterized protein n=1 Tax=Deinococcus arcticus TaxID=2136176 RepID=A0A2T3WCY7_9DEIO|nr:hypothetical protein [Deinococcus arcticus]PTA69765.1 hypothetical protein C8263_01760 [Deinococcus arcticus]
MTLEVDCFAVRHRLFTLQGQEVTAIPDNIGCAGGREVVVLPRWSLRPDGVPPDVSALPDGRSVLESLNTDRSA